MKYVIAIIQPFRLDEVRQALLSIPEFPGLSVSKIEGFGQGRSRAHAASIEPVTDFAQKLKLECAVKEDMVRSVVNAIAKHAHTGNRGDGKIFVIDLLSVTRIRTGERDEDGLWSPTGH